MTTPPEIQAVLNKLREGGFEAFVVGGSVRDLLLKKKPKDWDIATNANPQKVQKLFPKNFYNNNFGTVTVLTGAADATVKEIEITTYRTEAEYSDQRHPDKIGRANTIEEDLARRDFTVNALALTEEKDIGNRHKDKVTMEGMNIIDPFGGLKDLNAKLIRAVGNPSERFAEDALRLMRAVRFAAQLDFDIEEETLRDLKAYATAIEMVAKERVRDEIVKIIMSDNPERGIKLMEETGLLALTIPELCEGVGVEQNKHHTLTVYEHNLKSLQYAAKYDYELTIRLAALLHDIGKPRTRRRKDDDYTFYGHEVIGARITEQVLRRLKFDNETREKVTHLVRRHMFYYDVGKVTEAGARRLLRRVGKEHFDDLIKLRIAERKGSGVPKAEPYRLRHLQFLVEKAAQEPITTSQLAINGNDLIAKLGMKPGPKIGGVLNALLAQVLDDASKNEAEYLMTEASMLKDKNPAELKALGEAAKDEAEKKREDDIKRKYHV
jgi:poly(A) polymerase/tRNA nucleotidyltransferase (CCA-adding enzyme)